MNRRRFLATSAALNIPLAAMPVTAAPWFLSGPGKPVRVVAATRFASGVSFAAAMRQLGARVAVTNGDPTPIWFGDLAHHFATGGSPVAGLTTARTALVMTELARGPGVRMLWRAEHRPEPNRAVVHEIQGLSPLVKQARESDWTADWITALVAGLTADVIDSNRQTGSASAILRAPGASDRPEETLASWILAPHVPGLS